MFAAKPQKLNPNKQPHVDDWSVWEKIETDAPIHILEQHGWYVSDVDNFVEWFAIKKICPESVTPRQARQALILNGITQEMIDSALNSLPSPTKELALAEWNYSISIVRNRKLTNDVATMLNWSQFQLDQLFVFAGGL